MSDRIKLKKLAEAIASCQSILSSEEVAWMRRTTGQSVVDLIEEVEEFESRIPEWTGREIKLIADLEVSNNVGRALGETLGSVVESRDALVRVVDQLKVENEALRENLEHARRQPLYSTRPGYRRRASEGEYQ